MGLEERTKIQLLAPVVKGRKGEHTKLLEKARRSGFVRAKIDGNVYELSEEIKLEKNIKHLIEIIVDRLVVKPGIEKRLTDSIETVLGLSEGLLVVEVVDNGELLTFSSSYARIVGLVWRKWSLEVFLLTILLGLAPIVLVWDIRWNLMKI